MGINLPWVGHDVAPTDDLAGRHGDQLRIALLDIAENEGPRRLEWWGFQKRKIAPLPCDEVERPMKAFDMALRYRNNFDCSHGIGNVLIPPLAE